MAIAYQGPAPIMPLLQEAGEHMTTSALHSPKSAEIVGART